MQITKLELINYRNHKNLSMEFAENTTLIIGGNGSGKTNIIEAINMLSTGRDLKQVLTGKLSTIRRRALP